MVDRLRPGDIVEVKSPAEILETLDARGTSDRLPFMPEMIPLCGQRFRLSKRVVKTCTSGVAKSSMRKFLRDDVVVLEGVRCTGADHDGCQKGCMIFFREAWLRRAGDTPPRPPAEDAARLRARLTTSMGPNRFFCQASELLNTTRHLSRWERAATCIADIRAGNSTVAGMVRTIGIWLIWKARKTVLGEYARGRQTTTPREGLGLQRGEMIDVKSMEEILATVNDRGRNRGLYFTPDMRLLCGSRRPVDRRVDTIIVDGTGEMRRLRHTVYLEGSQCGCAHVAFGGCPRGEFAYWREIWLRRPAKSG